MDAIVSPGIDAPPLPEFGAGDLLEARALNRRLARTPRFRVRGQWEADLLNGLIGASQAVAGFRRHRPFPFPQPFERAVSAGGQAVRVRITPAEGPCRGAYLDIHGGAWAVGNARMNDPTNAALARAGYAVAGVEYRRAGRHPLEACLLDCEAAARWLLEEGAAEFGAARVFVGGESAGAHLAACTLLRLRDHPAKRPVSGAVLFYGVYDLAGTPSLHAADRGTLVLHGPSAARNLAKLTPGLTEAERRDPSLSPLHADLRALPPALMPVGELDPLLDDTLLLHARWLAAGSRSTLLRVPESPHAFNRFRTRIAARTAAYVRNWLDAQPSAADPAGR